MVSLFHQKRGGAGSLRGVVRLAALCAAVCMLLSTAACRRDGADDKNLTETLVKSYMDAFCGYDISKMNGSSLLKMEPYYDSDEVNESCQLLASRTGWRIESVNISGNAAIAQLTVTLPADYESICRQALDDAMLQIEQDSSDRLPAEILHQAIKKYLGKQDKRTVTAELSLSKVNNKWYVAKSQDITGLLSEIRTPVAAVYSVIGQ